MLPYAPQSLQGLLRVDDPSSTSLITIPVSTDITRRVVQTVYVKHEEHAKWSQYGRYRSMEARMPSFPSRPIPAVLLSPYPSSIQHRHTPMLPRPSNARKHNAAKPSAFVCDEWLRRRMPHIRLWNRIHLFFIPDILFGLDYSSQTEVALVEPDIKAFHASFAIAGQDERYRVSDCGEDSGVRTGSMKEGDGGEDGGEDGGG
ncbi:hypothetical protein M422DRAFT_243980 [Sphaerobolus stellatus SS14]|nr:hypothetical protein M422DRAFT_243980 [Sphaerobolus stellatus SS14]